MVHMKCLQRGGGIGDALFFFISGYTLLLGKRLDFINWYKRRLSRIYPAILATGLVVSIIFRQEYSFMTIMSAEKYWFVQCILVCYLLLYPIIRKQWDLSFCLILSIAVVLITYFTLFDFEGKLFYGVNNYFRWIFYFSVMLFGVKVSSISNKIVYNKWSIPALFCCCMAWYSINFIAKGGVLSLLSMIPLFGICYYAYQTGKAPWIEHLFNTKFCGNFLFIVGNLCLESYLIQKYLFTDVLNFLFPLNIIIIMIAVLVAAYFLHILSQIVRQIFDSKPFEWKELMLYKK